MTFTWQVLLSAAVFLALVLVQADLPGLYMDGVNPDFLAAQLLHHNARQPSAGLPSKIFPILGSLYHGTQNVYVGLPIFALFGFSVTALRLCQALFGAILLAALCRIAYRLTKSAPLVLLCGLGLASELAFTASFRTQFYIVLGGAAWLFVSLAYAIPREEPIEAKRRRVLLSGVFAGLACYGYFVLGFFVPGVLLMIALRRPGGWRDLPRWLAGGLIGLLPYALGYLSLLLKLKGIGPTLAFMQSMFGQLQPFNATAASGSNFSYAWEMARLAITDGGNEAMIFGQTTDRAWATFKFGSFALSLVALTGLCLFRLIRRDQRVLRTLPVLLPWSFLAIASLFGHRLWAHHFSVLVPFTYLLSTMLLMECVEAIRLPKHWRTATAIVLIVACLAANLTQQVIFHRELARTGGTGKMPEALNTLAIEARSAPSQVAYLFPEWGFYTSFCFLTGNRVRYVDDVQASTFAWLRSRGYHVFRLAYWDKADGARYRQLLLDNGASTVTERVFNRRDGQPAFYLLEAQ